MTNWSLGGQIQKVINDGTFYTANTASSANTKGDWTQCVSGLNYDSCGFFFGNRSQTYQADYLYDIAIGAEGSEYIIVNNFLNWCANNDYRCWKANYFPLFIPKNTRIAVRSQSTYAGINGAPYGMGFIQGRGFGANNLCTKCYTYGAATGDSGGTLVDPGGVANTWGTQVEFISSLPEDIKGFNMVLGNRNTYTRANALNWLFELSIGASGYEEPILQWPAGTNANVDVLLGAYTTNFIPITIPKGERIAIRSKCSVTGSERYLDVALYCFA